MKRSRERGAIERSEKKQNFSSRLGNIVLKKQCIRN
jgi:hypothetical protein